MIRAVFVVDFCNAFFLPFSNYFEIQKQNKNASNGVYFSGLTLSMSSQEMYFSQFASLTP